MSTVRQTPVKAIIASTVAQASTSDGILRSSSLPCRQSKPQYNLRLMRVSDVPEVLDVWRSIGLHEGTCTIQSFMTVDPEGFIVAEEEQTGVFVDKSVAFIGLYAVKPRYQGRGIGMSIWNKLMSDHIGDSNVGLYAVPEHLTTYRDKAGFRNEDTIRMLVYECESLPTKETGKVDLQLFCDDLVKSLANIDLIIIRPEDEVSEQLHSLLCQYDSTVTFVDRGKLLRATVKEKDTLTIVAFEKLLLKSLRPSSANPGSNEPTNCFTLSQFMDHISNANLPMQSVSVTGYIHIRTNNINKAMIGPLYANNDAIAELLVYQGISFFPSKVVNRGILFMTHDCSAGGKRIAEKLKLTYCEDLPRFFKKSIPRADFDRIYCIHTPNFSPY